VDEVQKVADLAKSIFLRDGFHAPIVITKGTKGGRAVLLEQFGDTADERIKDMFYAGAMLADKGNIGELELIVFVSEAWMGTNMYVLPSQDPKRIEALMVHSLDARTKEEQLLSFEVKRDPKGKVFDLTEMVLPKDGEPKGKLLQAFQKGYQIISPVHN
jgi:hypothetical protein